RRVGLEVTEVDAAQEAGDAALAQARRVQAGREIDEQRQRAADERLDVDVGDQRDAKAEQREADVEVLAGLDGVVPLLVRQIHNDQVGVLADEQLGQFAQAQYGEEDAELAELLDEAADDRQVAAGDVRVVGDGLLHAVVHGRHLAGRLAGGGLRV